MVRLRIMGADVSATGSRRKGFEQRTSSSEIYFDLRQRPQASDGRSADAGGMDVPSSGGPGMGLVERVQRLSANVQNPYFGNAITRV